jgi:translation initiation factor IF-1
VIEALPNRVLRVGLPNGHRVLGFCAGRSGLKPEQLQPGDRVNLEMTPYDMSKARVVGVAK